MRPNLNNSKFSPSLKPSKLNHGWKLTQNCSDINESGLILKIFSLTKASKASGTYDIYCSWFGPLFRLSALKILFMYSNMFVFYVQLFLYFYSILRHSHTVFWISPCDYNHWYRNFNYAYLYYLPSPPASRYWLEA